MSYTRVNWYNGATGGTPLSAANLNIMDAGIKALDDDKADVSAIPTVVSDLTNDAGYITNTALTNLETKGYLTIGGTTYQVRTGASGASGYITIEVE